MESSRYDPVAWFVAMNAASSDRPTGADFLTGDDEMTRLIRSKDWAQTPLGQITDWPQSLRTTVSLCLASNFPINIIWGSEHAQIYNDGYRLVCGDAHPVALGQGYDVTWASAWPAIGGPFERARAGETSFLENQRMFLTRNGYLEETFFTFSLSPIRDETGAIGGLFHPVTETTPAMLAERRTRALRDLTASLSGAGDMGEFATRAITTLAAFDYDLPFLLLYELDVDGGVYRLTGRSGIAADTAAGPATLSPEAVEPWPIATTAFSLQIVESGDVLAVLQDAACGPYEEPPARAFILPIAPTASEQAPAVLIAGASPRLPLDDAYCGFYELLAATLGAALVTVRAREDERRRAEALAAIDRAKTAFFSNVSHEFRTPLTLMLGPIEDVLAGELDARHREQLEVAHRNALRLLKLVNALLDFSRIEAGRVQARFEPVDLAELTAHLASNFRSACERAGLDLRVDCEQLPGPIHVDHDMWEKVVLNLISNAFKFTLAGGIEISLRPTATGAELIVRDTGIGIAADELPRVFDRFHRIEGQRGRTHEGTGIGLSLVQELVALHGGTITAESVEGIGTTFRVALHAGTDHLSADNIAAADATASSTTRADSFVGEALRWLPDAVEMRAQDAAAMLYAIEDRPRVILADDNADMRAYVRRILEEGGYQVEAVENGAAALAAARCVPIPDLVLSDVMMPVMGGFELLATIRADPALEGLIVILLSARAGEEAKNEGLASGADDYLVKPFGTRELRARIDGAIRLGRQRKAAAVRERELHATLATERSRAELLASEQELTMERRLNQELDARVNERTTRLRESNARLHLLEQITRAIGQREDVASVLAVAVRALEERLPADFVCICMNDATSGALRVAHIGAGSALRGSATGLAEGIEVSIDRDGLARCVNGDLVYEPDITALDSPYPRLARQGLRSLVLAPLVVERGTSGVLVVARYEDHAFQSADCEFLSQLGAHVGLALRQTQLHDDLRRAYDELERTQQAVLEQERLRAIGQMASGIAHDINNAISPVAIYTQSMLERDPAMPRETRDYLELVGRTVQDIAATVGRMRDFYRPDGDREGHALVDINALVPQVIDLTRARWSDMPQQRGKVVTVTADLDSALPPVLGGASELRELLTNLIFNSVDAMPDGGTVTIRTRTLYSDTGAPLVRLEVADTGVGMDEDTRSRCLEPFFTTKGELGTGLGLAMASVAAQRHDARLEIDSAPREGTRILLDFAAADEPRVTKPATAATVKMRGLRLLLVDDDPAVLSSTSIVLELDGHTTIVAEGGQAGLDALRVAHETGEAFDAIVTDLGMPHVDGEQVARAAKELFPTTPVVLLTGWGRRMSSGDDAPTNVDFLLPKPLDLNQLREIFGKVTRA
jgi:signal transduction histidine kinase/DNA-binding response OmpR family regulator